MKKILATATIMLSSLVAAETVQIPIRCAPVEVVAEGLRNIYGEIPIGGGRGIIEYPEGPGIAGDMVFYASPEKDTFSVTLVPDERPDVMCVLLVGSSLAPIETPKGSTL